MKQPSLSQLSYKGSHHFCGIKVSYDQNWKKGSTRRLRPTTMPVDQSVTRDELRRIIIFINLLPGEPVWGRTGPQPHPRESLALESTLEVLPLIVTWASELGVPP